MNPQQLAEAVIHWLQFERLCGRAELFSEAALRMPVGQYLMTSQDHLVIPEYPMPDGSGKAIDYCLRRRAGVAVIHAIEAKWIRRPLRPTLTDEIYNDLYRLASARFHQGAQPCARWLLIAGESAAIQTGVFDRELNAGHGRVSAFEEILGDQLGDDAHHRIYDVQGKARLPYADKWKASAETLGHTHLVSSIATHLLGKFTTAGNGAYSCFVWRVTFPTGWGSRLIANLFPQ